MGQEFKDVVSDKHAQYIQRHLDMNNDKMKTFIESKNAEYRSKVQDDRKQNDLMLEGRAQAFSIEVEKKMMEKLEDIKSKFEKRDLNLKEDYTVC